MPPLEELAAFLGRWKTAKGRLQSMSQTLSLAVEENAPAAVLEAAKADQACLKDVLAE
jgi:hypothetical protein